MKEISFYIIFIILSANFCFCQKSEQTDKSKITFPLDYCSDKLTSLYDAKPENLTSGYNYPSLNKNLLINFEIYYQDEYKKMYNSDFYYIIRKWQVKDVCSNEYFNDTQYIIAKINEINKEFKTDINIFMKESESCLMNTLLDNYPNPFDNLTNIPFYLTETQTYELTIFDINGKIVKLYKDEGQKGVNNVEFISSGYNLNVLFYKLQTKSFCQTKKMVNVK